MPFSMSRMKETPLSEQSFVPCFNQLCGSKELRNFLMSGTIPAKIITVTKRK